MVNAIDCTGLSPTGIANLVKQGVKYVGRYLSHSTWKGLSVGEVANIKAAGLEIFSIYETNPTKVSYFVPGKGKTDAADAVSLAKAVGQPEGSAIYFTVDYDAQAADLQAILNYFNEIKANLPGYKVGAYGSFTVLNYLHQNNAADYWFQTLAWSNGQRCNFLNLYQYQIDKQNWNGTGVNVDLDNLERADIGSWGQIQAAKPPEPPKPSIRYQAHVQNIGWQGIVKDGATAGTTGQSLRMEALIVGLDNSDAKLSIVGHVQNYGWQTARTNGEVIGTVGEGLRLEAIKIDCDKLKLTYRVHVQDTGWTDWFENGQVAGTVGQSLRLEAIEIKIKG